MLGPDDEAAHVAGVTLGMKNLIGAYPGALYQAICGRMHDVASKVEPSGTASGWW